MLPLFAYSYLAMLAYYCSMEKPAVHANEAEREPSQDTERSDSCYALFKGPMHCIYLVITDSDT